MKIDNEKKDTIDNIITKHKNYIFRHYNSKSLIKRLLWRIMGFETFYSIVYDVADIAFTEGQKTHGNNEKKNTIDNIIGLEKEY